MTWEKYTHGQLKELALKYNHVVGIKNVGKLTRRELEQELSKHLEVRDEGNGKHSVTIKSKTEIWRPRTDVGEEEAKKAYEKVKHEVIGKHEKMETKMEEKKERKKRAPRKPKSEEVEEKEKKPRGRPKKVKV